MEAFKESARERPMAEKQPLNFFEAFRDSANRHPGAVDTSSSELRPGQPLSVSEAVTLDEARKREEQARAQERLAAQQREEEEQARLKAKQKEVERQIEQLRESILKIAKSTQSVSSEIEKAAFETPVAPGTYHLSFFEKLRSTLEFVKKRLDDSASWLSTMNQRNQKRQPFFWAQVKKSGTKYMLSSERYVQMAG